MVDAVGGVAKIVGVALRIKEAVNTVHQNKKDCHHIKSRVDILNRTLSQHGDNAELMEDSAVMAALEALDGILAEALEIITKCQEERSIVCVYCTAGKLSRQLSKVEQRISNLSSDAMLTIMSYLLLMKFQEAAPCPPPQIYPPGTCTPLQPPSSAGLAGRRVGPASARRPGRARASSSYLGPPIGQPPPKVHGGPATHTTLQPSSRPQAVPKFGAWEVADHMDPTEWEFWGRAKVGGSGRDDDMVVEPPSSLVHRIAEVSGNNKEAVKTVLQNRDDCVEIAKRVNKVSTLLSQLEDTEMVDGPAMRRAVEKLLETFRRAHTLVIACQRRVLAIMWLSTPPGRLSTQLHDVLDQMASNIADMTAIVLP